MRKFFANLKAVVGAVVMVSMLSTAALSTSCSNYDDEINNLQGQIDNLADRVAQLESDFLSLAGVLDGIVLNAEQNADGNWVITTEGGKINITVEGDFDQEIEIPECELAEGGITVIEEDGVYYWAIIENGEATALTVDGAMVPVVNDVTLAPEVRQNPVSGKTEFTVDGANWYEIGVVFQDVAVEGNTLVLTLGSGDKVSVPMAQQLVFEINSGKANFASEETRVIRIITENIDALSILSAPKGWTAAINADNALEITAPNEADTEETYDEYWMPIPATADAEGVVKVLAYGADGRTLVGKLTVTIEAGVAVNVNGTNVEFVGGSDWGWPVEYVYGISTEETFEADVTAVLTALEQYQDVPEYATWGEETITTTVKELLGAEPVVGTRYVVWAYADNYEYTLDEVAYAYYEPVGVNATLIADKTNAFNIEVSLEVEGADSYLALVLPEHYMYEAADYYKATMAESVSYGSQYQYYGVVWAENFTGSLENLTANSSYSATGQYAPNQKWALFVMPFDGRPLDSYTAADVFDFEFSTTGLEAGGVVTATVVEVDKYMATEYSYEIWDYVTVEKEVDPLKEMVVSITPSDEKGWLMFYFGWFDAETLALLGTDEAIVDELLTEYPISAMDVEEYPMYEINRTNPGTEETFVCFFVDANGKYGEMTKVTCKTDELQQSDMTLTVTSNLSGAKLNRLANTTALELTLTPSGEASKYKYVAQETTYYNAYEGQTAADMAKTIALSNDAKEITPADLVDGVWSYDNHAYGTSYYLAILAYDAEGLPCKEAVIFEYDCVVSFDTVITDEAQFVAEPTVEFVPFTYVESATYEGGTYWMQDYTEYYNQGWYDYKVRYGFYFGYTFTVPEGCAEAVMYIMPDEDYYIAGGEFTAADKCADLWSLKWGDYYMPQQTAADGAIAYERNLGFGCNYDYNHYLMLSWKDAEGNVYYKEVNLNETLMADALADLEAKSAALLYAEDHAAKLKDQWVLPADVAAIVATEGAEGIVDLGVSSEGQMLVAIDYESVYGAEAAGVWQTMMAMDYTIEPTGETTGNIVVAKTDMFGDTTYTNVPYSELGEGTVKIDFSFLGCGASTVTPYDGEVTLDAGGGMMM